MIQPNLALNHLNHSVSTHNDFFMIQKQDTRSSSIHNELTHDSKSRDIAILDHLYLFFLSLFAAGQHPRSPSALGQKTPKIAKTSLRLHFLKKP